jgi:PII-like signaling protein
LILPQAQNRKGAEIMETEANIKFVRLYLHETDHGRRRSLMQEILTALRGQDQIGGITVFRGIAGVGEKGEVLAEDMLRLTVDLPLVIEFYADPTEAERAMVMLGRLAAGHPVVSWPARLSTLST